MIWIFTPVPANWRTKTHNYLGQFAAGFVGSEKIFFNNIHQSIQGASDLLVGGGIVGDWKEISIAQKKKAFQNGFERLFA